MTKNQKGIIASNLHAFVHNFGDVRIEDADYGGGFYVFYPPNSLSYIQYCENIHYLDGWLYGAVQGVRIIEPTRQKNGIKAMIDDN